MADQNPYKPPIADSSPDSEVSHPEYLISCRTPAGKKSTERVRADSADAAMRQLKDQGYTNLVLHTDDAAAQFTNLEKTEKHISAAEYVAFSKQSEWSHFWWLFFKLNRSGWPFLLLATIWFVVRRGFDKEIGLLDYAAISFVVLPSLFAIVAWALNPKRAFDRLLDDIAWGRWEQALKSADRVSRLIDASEVAFRRATAMAGLGRLDEGLAVVKEYGRDEQIPKWMYLSRLNEIYAAADRREEGLQCLEDAHRLAPDNPTVMIDLGLVVLLNTGGVERAEQLLASARTHELAELVDFTAVFLDGLIALHKERYADSQRLIHSAIESIMPFNASNPLVGMVIDTMLAFEAIALASLGNKDAAQRLYEKAEPRMKALGRDRVIEMYQTAMRNPG